jgi:hypothetical protein
MITKINTNILTFQNLMLINSSMTKTKATHIKTKKNQNQKQKKTQQKTIQKLSPKPMPKIKDY